jgi:hypothetical protein
MELEATTLIDSIVRTIANNFKGELYVYDGKLTQNVKTPCIFVTENNMASKAELYSHYMETHTIEFEIHCANSSQTATSENTEIYSYTRKIAYRLRDILMLVPAYKYNDDRTKLIETDDIYRGFNFNWHIYDDKGYVYVTYKYRIVEKDTAEKLQNLSNTTNVKNK